MEMCCKIKYACNANFYILVRVCETSNIYILYFVVTLTSFENILVLFKEAFIKYYNFKSYPEENINYERIL